MSKPKKGGRKAMSGGIGRKGKGPAQVKKVRGPKSHLELSKGKVDEMTVQGAEEMLDGDSGEDDDEEEGEGEQQPKRKPLQNWKSRNTDFLLTLDEKGVSKTNAEVQRLRKEDLARSQREDRQNGIKRGKGKAKAKEVDEVSDAESTDMEGASVLSGSGGDDDSDIGIDLDDSDYSEMEEEDGRANDREMSLERETNHVEKIERRQKRRLVEEEKDSMQRKKKKLPTRGAEGWSSGEEVEEEEEDDDDEDEDFKSMKQKSKQEKKSLSRVVHDPLPEPLREEERKTGFPKPKSTIMTGTRFGLQSPYDILKIAKKSQRVMMAREQIARLSTDIINDPEVSLGFIKRLSVFAGTYVQSAEDNTQRATVDDAIRASAILSLCAIFVDVLPGYRIRSLTEAEAKEKVNQELARRREWEQGLVIVYRDYLELCERVTRDRTDLSKVSLKAMCTLVTKATHFNYRTNLLRSLVSYLSRKSWDSGSNDANEALIQVLKTDNHGEVSLEIVRLLNRMIKEKKFNVNERVLEMLRHLRLKDELQEDKRGDLTSVSRNTDAFNKSLRPKDVRKGKGQHLSKKGVKKMKEVREIEEELKEAEAEVNKEERERHQSETLKLLFVLYFSILKAPIISNKLYIATLQGLALFAHRINVDFFRDLLDVLRQRIRLSLVDLVEDGEDSSGDDDEDEEEEEEDRQLRATNLMTALHCIATSFELLSGQGEALNIDLSDMVGHLFSILLPLCINPNLEASKGEMPTTNTSDAALLLRAIHLCLVAPPIYSLPIERLAAFIVRLLNCSLHTPPKTCLGLLQVVRILMSKKEELKGLFDNSDRAKNGQFDPSSDLLDGLRPLQSGYIPWQLSILQFSCHEEVRQQSEKILAL